MIKEIEKEKVHAFCPHCLKEMSLVWICRIESIIGTRYIFFCSECQKSLGTSHEKGFISNKPDTTIKNINNSINNPS
jgi:hypothetical protein